MGGRRAGPGTEAVFVWTAGVAKQLPGLSSLGAGQRSIGRAINARGDVVGHVIHPTLPIFYPVLWRDGAAIALSESDGGHHQSEVGRTHRIRSKVANHRCPFANMPAGDEAIRDIRVGTGEALRH